MTSGTFLASIRRGTFDDDDDEDDISPGESRYGYQQLKDTSECVV